MQDRFIAGVEGLLRPETRAESRLGIVLTAGAERKRSPILDSAGVRQVDSSGNIIYGQRLMPILEGQLRSMVALRGLACGNIDGLIIVGGALKDGRPEADIYREYLLPCAERRGIDPSHLMVIKSGRNTDSDLDHLRRLLMEFNYGGTLAIYSSGYHLAAKPVQEFVKKLKCQTIFERVEEDSTYKRVAKRIFTPAYVAKQEKRYRRRDYFPSRVRKVVAYFIRG